MIKVEQQDLDKAFAESRESSSIEEEEIEAKNSEEQEEEEKAAVTGKEESGQVSRRSTQSLQNLNVNGEQSEGRRRAYTNNENIVLEDHWKQQCEELQKELKQIDVEKRVLEIQKNKLEDKCT